MDSSRTYFFKFLVYLHVVVLEIVMITKVVPDNRGQCLGTSSRFELML